MFVILTLIGVFVAFLIKRLGTSTSYCYDDEDELIEEEESEESSNDQIQIKHVDKQNQDYINIQTEKSTQMSGWVCFKKW